MNLNLRLNRTLHHLHYLQIYDQLNPNYREEKDIYYMMTFQIMISFEYNK